MLNFRVLPVDPRHLNLEVILCLDISHSTLQLKMEFKYQYHTSL